MLLETDFDVIVAGGGLTGTIAAQAISYYSNQNQRILSVDRNPEHLPGRKSSPGWTCGDACSKEAVDFMTERIKVPWTRPEICLLYTSPSPRDGLLSRMPSSA